MSSNPNPPGSPPAAGSPGAAPAQEAPAPLPDLSNVKTADDWWRMRPSERQAVRDADPAWVDRIVQTGQVPPTPPRPRAAAQGTSPGNAPAAAPAGGMGSQARREQAIRTATLEALLGTPGVSAATADALTLVIGASDTVVLDETGRLQGFTEAFEQRVSSGAFNLAPPPAPAAPLAPMPRPAQPSSGSGPVDDTARIQAAVKSRDDYFALRPTVREALRQRDPQWVARLLR